MISNKDNNPLNGVSVGSTVDAGTLNFSHSQIHGAITKLDKRGRINTDFMSGESSFVYKETMNSGALGLGGSYGVSGLMQVSSSFDAYVGQSAALSSKSIRTHYNSIIQAGVEFVDFDNLTVTQFLAALSGSARDAAMSALKHYNAVMADARKQNVSVRDVVSGKVNNPEVRRLIDEWLTSSDEFVRRNGFGIVMAVFWGAYGAVSLTMTSKQTAEAWTYGGSGSFSYAGTGKSVTVGAAYDGGRSNSASNVEVSCTAYSCGSAIEKRISEWFDAVNKLARDELWEIDVMKLQPQKAILPSKEIPAFSEPKPDEETKQEVDKLDLSAVETLAQESAFKQASQKNKDLTFSRFVEDSGERADTSKLKNLIGKIKNNVIEGSPEVKNGASKRARIAPEEAMAAASTADAPDSGDEMTPLGVWIARWPDLFPWLAQGYMNAIVDDPDIGELKRRTFIQDCLTLKKIYYCASSSGITELRRKDIDQQPVSTRQLADEFGNAASSVQSGESASLGVAAQKIYDIWNANSLLRNAELGLGLLCVDQSIRVSASHSGDDKRMSYRLAPCQFDEKHNNQSVFSEFFKLLPLITPDGEIIAFGPAAGGLSSIYANDSAVFSASSDGARYMKFLPDGQHGLLKNDDARVRLYPIRFAAANGTDWLGQSVSTGISCDQHLVPNLTALDEQLRKLNAWSFSSDAWKDGQWEPDTHYAMNKIPKQYIGIADAPANIFK
ncbi:hypothetical protein [Burkholderia sp. 22313]|uniref:hypothetical protein n=1 Tax=Burkholderia sp. 22313 TaxID=3453908 RepID=UPI003F8629DE